MAGDSGDDPTFDEVNDSLYASGATDGLPVIPPTEERVEEMLRGTDLPRDHELGRLGSREGKLTVEKLATNGVMAGCKPIHMPVLVAGAKALADPDSNAIQFSISAASWAYLWIVNGPIRERLDIRSDTGAFGPKFRANRVIARALGLAYKNTALIHPGEKDMGLIGNPFKYSLLAGENEERSPWEPYHVTQGFDAEESTITLGGPRSFVQFVPYEMSADGVLQGMRYNMIPDMTAIRSDSQNKTVFYMLSPYNARELADADLTKDEIKQYLCNNSALPADEYQSGAVIDDDSIGHPVAPGRVERLQIPQIEAPEQVNLTVVGGSGRFNAVGHTIGGPVTKRIEVPDEWETLLEEYRVEREWGRTSEA